MYSDSTESSYLTISKILKKQVFPGIFSSKFLHGFHEGSEIDLTDIVETGKRMPNAPLAGCAFLGAPTQTPTQGPSWRIKRMITGCYRNTVLMNVVGLPLAEVVAALKAL